MKGARNLARLVLLSAMLGTSFACANSTADLELQIKKYPANTQTTLNQLIADFNLDMRPIQELLPVLSPLLSSQGQLLVIPIAITRVKKVSNGYQLTGTLSIASLECIVAIRIIQETPSQRGYAIVIRPKPKQSNEYSLSAFLGQFKTILPAFLSSILDKLDEYIKITAPIIALSTIKATILDPILGVSGIKTGCSAILYIADAPNCVLCQAKTDSGLEKLGISIRFNKKPTSFKDLSISPLFEVDPSNGICLFKIFTAVVQKAIDDIGANNPTLKEILDTLSFCLHSNMGMTTDENGNMIFYAVGEPKMPAPKSTALGKFGIIKGSMQDGFKFSGGIILGDDIALKANGLRDKGFAAKFGSDIINLLDSELEFKNPIISATNQPQGATLFDIDPICSKMVDPAPQKQAQQAQELQQCRTKKITQLEKKLSRLQDDLANLQNPTEQTLEDSEDLDLDLDLEIEDLEEETLAESKQPETKTPEQLAKDAEERKKKEEERIRNEIEEKKSEIKKTQEQLREIKNTAPFDFSQIRTVNSGIVFEVSITSKQGSTLDTLLRPLHLQKAKMQLVIPLKKGVTRSDIKLKLTPQDLSPIYLKDVIQLGSIIDALPPDIPLAKDLQQLNFKPSATEFDVNAKGQPTIIVKGTIAGSPILGEMKFELYKEPERTVIALSAPTSPNFALLFGSTFDSFFAPITQSFVLSKTLITFVSNKNKNTPPTQMMLFDEPQTLNEGVTIKTHAQITQHTPDVIKKALESANITNVDLDIRAPSQDKLSIEITPASKEQEKISAPIQFCPGAFISEILSPFGADQLLGSIDKKLCLATKIFYIKDKQQSILTVNGYSKDQQATFTYESSHQAETEKKAFGFAIKSITIPGVDITIDEPLITYSETPNAKLFRFDQTTLEPNFNLPGITVPQGFAITAKKFCPFDLITSLGVDLGSITQVCIKPTITFSTNGNQRIIRIDGSDGKETQVELKITCKPGAPCTKTLGIRVSDFTVPFVDMPIKNPVITYTDAISDTIFDNTTQPLTVKKGIFVNTDIPADWPIIGPLKKYIQSVQIDLINKSVSINYNPATKVCLQDIVAEIPDFLNLCITPDRMIYNKQDGLTITGRTTLFNAPTTVLIQVGQKKLIAISPQNFSLANLPAPLNSISELIDLENACITYAGAPTKFTMTTPDGKIQEALAMRGFNLTGQTKLKGILDDIFGFISKTMQAAIPLINTEEINLSTKVEKDLGILDLHSANIILHPKNLSVFDLALDTTIKGGDGVNLKFKGTGSATGLNLTASLKCNGTNCPSIDLEKAIGLPIKISPIAAGSPDCPKTKTENGKTSCMVSRDAVCSACIEAGLPLSFEIGVTGGIPKALGISGLFEINEQKFYVNSKFDATDIKRMGMLMQSNKVCLEKIILMLTQFVIKELGINFKIPDLFCFENVDLNIAALPTTINNVRLMPGALVRGEFDFLGLKGTMGLCIRTPLSTGQAVAAETPPNYDICKSGNKNVNFGIFAKGFIKPLAIAIGERPIVAIMGSSKEPNSPGAGLDLELLSNDKQRMDINGRLVILPKSSDINSQEARTGILQNDMQLLLDIGSGILTGTSEITLGSTTMHTEVTLNLPHPLESSIVARAENVGINAAIDLIEQLVGGNFTFPAIPTVGLKVSSLELRIGNGPTGFGAGIKAHLDWWGQEIILEGTASENGLILKGRLSPVKFLASEDILYITDAQNPAEGPSIDVELTKNPLVRISGKASLLHGVVTSRVLLLTRQPRPGVLKSDFSMNGNFLGFSTDFTMEQQLTIKPDQAPSFDKWTITGKINDNLTDDIMRIFNTVFGPIKTVAEISYKYSVGAVKSMKEECHKIPVIADILCAPLDIATPILETAGSVFKKIQDLAGPNMFHINSITFSADLTQLQNITDVSKMELPSLKIDFTILGEKKDLELKQVTLPTLPQKMGEQVINIVNPQKLLDDLLDIGSKFGNMLADILKSVGEAIKHLAEQVFKEVGKAAEAVFDAGKQAVEAVAQFGEDAINAIGEEVAAIGKAIDQAIAQLNQVFTQIGAELNHIANEVAQAVQQAVAAVTQALENVAGEIRIITNAIAEELSKLARIFCFGIFC